MSLNNDTISLRFSKYPSIEQIRRLVRYTDGRLYWLERPLEYFPCVRIRNTWNSRYAGQEVGYLCTDKKSGHQSIRTSINDQKIGRHIIVWAIHNGSWPYEIDHIDRNPINDRIENLRECNQSQNNANQTISSRNKSGFKGVCWDKARGKWKATIMFHKKTINLGRFDDIEDAKAAYKAKSIEIFGEFATDGEVNWDFSDSRG